MIGLQEYSWSEYGVHKGLYPLTHWKRNLTEKTKDGVQKHPIFKIQICKQKLTYEK